jgi:hypothetical protein
MLSAVNDKLWLELTKSTLEFEYIKRNLKNIKEKNLNTTSKYAFVIIKNYKGYDR